MSRQDATAGQAARPVYLTLVRPRCPGCQSTRLRAYKTTNNGEGSLTRYSRCVECGRAVVVVVE